LESCSGFIFAPRAAGGSDGFAALGVISEQVAELILCDSEATISASLSTVSAIAPNRAAVDVSACPRRNLCDDQAAGAFAVEFTQYVGDSVTGLTGRLNDGLELPLKPCESRPDEVRVCFYTLDVEVEELAEDRL
jgi:phage protein U